MNTWNRCANVVIIIFVLMVDENSFLLGMQDEALKCVVMLE